MLCVALQSNAQQLNCDSLKNIFELEINKAVKEGVDKATIQHLEATKNQLLQLYCNNEDKKVTAENNALADSYKKATTQNKVINNTFNSSYKISLSLMVDGEKINTYYYLNTAFNNILYTPKALEAAAKLKEQIAIEEDAVFDGWIMDDAGKNTYYATSKQEGKLAITTQLPLNKWLKTNNTTVKVKALNGTKKIAGYDCKAFKISGTDNGSKIDITAWITVLPFPFTHPTFGMFSMISAANIGINASPKSGVLLLDGRVGDDVFFLEITSIKPDVNSFVFKNYKIFF